MTPPAASRPKALPPPSRMAWTCGAMCDLSRGPRSRVPVAPPGMSTPPTAPCSHRTTVQPVRARASVACPTRKPAMSVSVPTRIDLYERPDAQILRGDEQFLNLRRALIDRRHFGVPQVALHRVL